MDKHNYGPNDEQLPPADFDLGELLNLYFNFVEVDGGYQFYWIVSLMGATQSSHTYKTMELAVQSASIVLSSMIASAAYSPSNIRSAIRNLKNV
jgi:hypothetical protein